MKVPVFAVAVVCAFFALADEEADGGYVTAPNNGKVIKIAVAGKAISESDLSNVAQSFKHQLGFPVSTVQADASAKPQDGMGDKVACLIQLVSDESTPTLLVAPEAGWATINVKPLKKDSPADLLFSQRVQKEAWRALAFVMGGVNSEFQPCLLRDLQNLSDLDKYPKLISPSPMVIGRITDCGTKRGIEFIREDTYRVACEEGWAPEPKTEVQRKIKAEVEAKKSSAKAGSKK